MKNLLGNIILVIFKLLAWLPLGVARRLGWLIGRLIYLSRIKSVAVMKINLKLCFPGKTEKEYELLCRQRCVELGQMFCETPGLWRRPAAWVNNHIVEVEGEELFHQAMSTDEGLILLVPHQGNWEAVGQWVGPRATMTALYEPPKMRALESYIKSSREKHGATLVPTDVRGVAALIKALKRGELSAILPDQQPTGKGAEFAPLYGTEAKTMTLIYNLVRRSGCQVLAAAGLRTKGGWSLHFMPVDEGIYSEDQAVSLAALNATVESVVALAPAQYQWEYKRFRARPEGEPLIYPRGS